MFFTRMLMDSPFDEDAIQKLYEHLSAEFADTELNWKNGRSSEDDPSEADFAEIRINGKAFFTMNRKMERAGFKFSVVEGCETKAINAIKESGLGYQPPELTNPILFATIYALIFFCLCLFVDSDIFPVLLVSFGLLITGVTLYLISLIHNLGNGILKTSSTIGIIGLLLLAPSSMLLFPLLTAMNKRSLYRKMDELAE